MQKIVGVITGTDCDSAGRGFAVVQPVDGSLSAFVYGVPSARKGGPNKGVVLEMLVIPGGLARNFTFAGAQPVDMSEAFSKAETAKTGERTVAAAAKLTDKDKADRAAKRATHQAALRAANAADEAEVTIPEPVLA